ncbi:putative bicarbonate transporter, IctB family [Romeria aff. gracilis LEGE 07310]|uniref:Putative bicarbonate transporter, IctB family n=1 Tax=Vasconcelosia minhoensis LEGE 07310 TaxID=915328 RepID=A0A8J7A9S8_9CYAN|nr:IctB family putative bicarbonate transporter [Romeria gracilis]MBE9079967.1 putative bicarbonate transporter, IctB family [Romeria aff. gracilis LEGE 07310]
MFNTALQRVTLSRFALDQWRQVSLLHRLLSPLRQWRQGSWLLQWGDAIGWVFLAIVFALAPYVSTALIGVLMVACAGLWLLLTVSDQAEGWLTPVHVVVTVYWGVMVLATALSPVKSAALVGLVKLTLNLLLFMLMARVLRRPNLRSALILVYLATAAIVSVYGIRQYYFGAEALATWSDPETNLSQSTRVYSYLGNPNLLAGYLMPAVGFSAAAFFVWPKWVPKGLAVVLWGISSVCLILTRSRGGWLGFVALSFVLMVLLVYWLNPLSTAFWRRWALPLLLGASAAVVVAAVLFVPSVQERVLTMFAGREDSSNNFRINVWESVVNMIRARPIIGIGPGNEAFNKVYPLFQKPNYTALSAYSIYLETAVEAGILGILSFAWLIGVSFYQSWVQINRLRQRLEPQGYWLMAAIAVQIGLLVQGAVDTIWYRPQVSTLWWLLMALIASYYVSLREKYRTDSLTDAA